MNPNMLVSPRLEPLPPISPSAQGDDSAILKGIPVPLAEPPEGNEAIRGLLVGLHRYTDAEGTDRWITVEGVNRHWNTEGYSYYMTTAQATQLAADLMAAVAEHVADAQRADTPQEM